MTKTKLGQVQLRIMRLLWRLNRTTARTLTEELNKSEPMAHSTVQTLLRQLEAKGSVGHEQEQRTFYFFPLVKEEKVRKSAARELIQSIFGSAGELVSHLLENEQLTRGELGEIQKLIDQREKQK